MLLKAIEVYLRQCETLYVVRNPFGHFLCDATRLANNGWTVCIRNRYHKKTFIVNIWLNSPSQPMTWLNAHCTNGCSVTTVPIGKWPILIPLNQSTNAKKWLNIQKTTEKKSSTSHQHWREIWTQLLPLKRIKVQQVTVCAVMSHHNPTFSVLYK